MKLSKILSTTVALSALAFASLSFAVPITINVNAGTTNNNISGTDSLIYISTVNGVVDGWELDVNIALAGNGAAAPDIFSLATTATKLGGGTTDLTITAIATGFTDLGTLSGHFASIGPGNTSAIDYSIDGGANWLSLATYNTGAGATATNVIFGSAPLVSYDLRITQFFTTSTGGSLTSTTVPEPSIIALLGFGLIGMSVATRRKQKKS